MDIDWGYYLAVVVVLEVADKQADTDKVYPVVVVADTTDSH